MPDLTAEDLIHRFGLKPHPEGGFYRETYRSAATIPKAVLPSPFRGDRSFCTAIYFLLPEGTPSYLHRIASDEIWHFYLGAPLKLVQRAPDGNLTEVVLGTDLSQRQELQHVVPAGCWFGAHSLGHFSFVGCTVAPGFDLGVALLEPHIIRMPDAEGVIQF